MASGKTSQSAWVRMLDVSWPAALALVIVFTLWESYARLSGIKATVLPAPSRVVEQIAINFPALISNALPTLIATLSGFALSVMCALILSVLVDFIPILKRALLPLMIISQTLPLIAIAPLVVLWFGFGLLPKVLLVTLVTFFPMMVALVQGYESTDNDLQRLMKSMGASRWKIFHMARLPSSLPFFFTGLRISITYAVVGAIFAEYAGAESGLGIYMLAAKNNFRSDLVLAAVTFSAAMTLILFACILLLERLCLPWKIQRDTTP